MANNENIVALNDRELRGKIILDEKLCRGCHSCMLACSFHHHSVFSKELSSIKVVTGYKEDKINWAVDYSSCDLCKGEENYLCVQHCSYESLSFADDGAPSEG
ncbi:MAG: 4Fe-4S dicluster domain-containing protein [Syntrophomonas sp.]